MTQTFDVRLKAYNLLRMSLQLDATVIEGLAKTVVLNNVQCAEVAELAASNIQLADKWNFDKIRKVFPQ